MNLIITTACNKNCSFCFAHEHNKKAEHMSLENLQKIIKFLQESKCNYVKLLGGEPTEHPNFLQFIEILNKNHINYTLISNLLIKNLEVVACIKDAIQNDQLDSILANASELSAKTEPLFIKNYMEYVPFVEQKNKFMLSCSITLSRHKSASAELDYIKGLFTKIPVYSLRLSLDFQGENQEDTEFINNHIYGEKIKTIMSWAGSKNIPISWDCKLYPCLFSDKVFVNKQLRNLINNVRFSCQNTMPLDVFPDLHYIHCYPAAELTGKNILDFPNLEALKTDLIFRKKIINYNKNIPVACQDCVYLQENMCDSLCLGCSEIISPLSKVPHKHQ